MKKILSLLFCFFLALPVNPAPVPYFAVFCNLGWENEWTLYHPNVVKRAQNWSDFEPFLQMIRLRTSKDTPLVIDIDVHGLDALYIEKDGKSPSYKASLGYIVNKIEEYFPKRQIVLILECCYAPNTYKQSIRDNHWTPDPGDRTGDCDHTPKIMIVGTKHNVISYSVATYMMYYHNIWTYIADLRQFEYAPNPRMISGKNNPISNAVLDLCSTLWTVDKKLYNENI